jgi:hypothetical protein
VDAPLKKLASFFDGPVGAAPTVRKSRKSPSVYRRSTVVPRAPDGDAPTRRGRHHHHHNHQQQLQQQQLQQQQQQQQHHPSETPPHPMDRVTRAVSKFLNQRPGDVASAGTKPFRAITRLRIVSKKETRNAETSTTTSNVVVPQSRHRRALVSECSIDKTRATNGASPVVRSLVERYARDTGNSREYAEHHLRWLAEAGSLKEFRNMVESLDSFSRWFSVQPDAVKLCAISFSPEVKKSRRRRRMYET